MFDKLMGTALMKKYKVVSDQIFTGRKELYDPRFVQKYVEEVGVDHYVYLTQQDRDSGLVKARFIAFEGKGFKGGKGLANRFMWICDNCMEGNPLMNEVGLTFMN